MRRDRWVFFYLFLGVVGNTKKQSAAKACVRGWGLPHLADLCVLSACFACVAVDFCVHLELNTLGSAYAGHCFWGCFGVWRGFGDYYFDEPFCDSRIGWGRWGFASIFCIPFYVGRSACKLARVLEDAEGAGPICIYGLFQQHLWLHESMRDSMARRCASNGSPCFCVTLMLGVCDARRWACVTRDVEIGRAHV